jgi:ankyrin repeat protein
MNNQNDQSFSKMRTVLFPESWICPISRDPLLNPVVASDGCMYNKDSFTAYCETSERGIKGISPTSEKQITKTYMEIYSIRECVLNLLTETDIFDDWLRDIDVDQIKVYRLENVLIRGLLNDKLKYHPDQYLATIMLSDNYIRAIDMIISNKLDVNNIWIHACENGLEQHALALMQDTVINHDLLKYESLNQIVCDLIQRKMNTLILKMLEEHIIDFSQTFDEMNTMLMLACKNENEDLGLKLLDLCQSDSDYLNRKNTLGENALIMCCRNRMETLGLKIMERENIEYSYRCNGNNVLSIACDNSMSEIALALLKKNESALCTLCEEHAFRRACKNGLTMVVDEFIKKGTIDYNARANNAYTGLIYACNYGHSDIALKLLACQNIDINYIDPDGDTAFLCACRCGLVEVVDKMLHFSTPLGYPGKSIDHYVIDNWGSTALLGACKYGHGIIALKIISSIEESMQRIDFDQSDLDKMIDLLNQEDNDGNTALIYACKNGLLDVVKKLLEHGADHNYSGPIGKTPIIVACEKMHEDIVMELMGMRCIDYKHADNYGNTVISLAHLHGMQNIINNVINRDIMSE